MEKSFIELGVEEKIVQAIEAMGFDAPTKVQHDAIPYILDGKDLIVMSKTGSGKTGAFGIPLLQQIDNSVDGVQALILTPTRELAVQVDEELNKMSNLLQLKTAAIYGQHNINTEIDDIKRGANVITGTPGRVFDHINRKTLKTSAIKFLVLDEADRMLDMGFFDQVVQIVKALPKQRVTLLFSATMPPEIQRICRTYMQDPITLELGSDTKTVDTIKQVYYRVEPKEKRQILDGLLKIEKPESCIIFCNTRSEVDWVHKYFSRKGYEIGALHGGNTQNSRMKTMERFKAGKLQLIVATDVAARGLHIDELSIVVNYDVPLDKDSYVHRIGRTGRVGNSGLAITLVTTDDIWSFYEIEEHVGVLIEPLELPTDEYIKECEESDDSEWAKRRREKAKILATTKHREIKRNQPKVVQHNKNRSSHQKADDVKHGHSVHKKIERKPLDRTSSDLHKLQPVKAKEVMAKPAVTKVTSTHTEMPKVHTEAKAVIKHSVKEPKKIDYRQEAKKLAKQAGVESKPSVLKKLGSLFNKKD